MYALEPMDFSPKLPPTSTIFLPFSLLVNTWVQGNILQKHFTKHIVSVYMISVLGYENHLITNCIESHLCTKSALNVVQAYVLWTKFIRAKQWMHII